MLSLKLCVDVAATARSMGCSSAARYPTELGLSAYYSPKILLSSDATFTVIGYFVSSEKTKQNKTKQNKNNLFFPIQSQSVTQQRSLAYDS